MKRNIRKRCTAALLSLLMLLPIMALPAQAAGGEDAYILAFSDSRSAAAFLAQRRNAQAVGDDPTLVTAALTAREAAAWRCSRDVDTLEKDAMVYANGDTDETAGASAEALPWNAKAVGADAAHSRGLAGQGVRVAVLDSGLDTLSEVVPCGGVDLVDPEHGTADDLTGHGTAVTGILAAPQDGKGLIGVASEADVFIVRVLDEHNASPVSRVLQALDWCIEQHMDVINMSFGTDRYSRLLEEKIQQAADAGILMISSAGNGDTVEYPARFAQVIAVSAVTNAMTPTTEESSFRLSELAAPGAGICSDSLLGGYGVCSGTSMASPHIAGAAAVLLSGCPDATPAQIRTLLHNSARHTDADDPDSVGVPDLSYALEHLSSPADTVIPDNPAAAQPYPDENTTVTGSWSASGHNGLADNFFGGTAYNIRFPLLIKRVSAGMDADMSDDKLLHGVSNYVAVSELLYEIAVRYKTQGAAFSHTQYRDDLIPVLGENNYRRLLSDVTRALSQYGASDLNANASDRANGATNFASVAEKTSAIVMGMFFHLVGDIYAHRTVVPPSSTLSTSASSHGSGSDGNAGMYFVQADFIADCRSHKADRSAIIAARYREKLDRLYAEMTAAEGPMRVFAVIRWLGFLVFGRLILTLTDDPDEPSEPQMQLDAALLQSALNIPTNASRGNMCGAHASCYGAMMRLAAMGVLQFKDIKYFLNGMEAYNTTGERSQSFSANWAYYEDQAPSNTFYARRYLLAKAVTQHYLESFFLSERSFDPYYLLAEPYGDTLSKYCLKIDQFYNYLYVLHSDSVVLTRAFWAGKTHSLFHFTTIVYEGTYFIDASTYPADYGKPLYDGVFPSRTDGKTADSFYVQ